MVAKSARVFNFISWSFLATKSQLCERSSCGPQIDDVGLTFGLLSVAMLVLRKLYGLFCGSFMYDRDCVQATLLFRRVYILYSIPRVNIQRY